MVRKPRRPAPDPFARLRAIRGPAGAGTYGLTNTERLNRYAPGDQYPIGYQNPTEGLPSVAPTGALPPALDPALRGGALTVPPGSSASVASVPTPRITPEQGRELLGSFGAYMRAFTSQSSRPQPAQPNMPQSQAPVTVGSLGTQMALGAAGMGPSAQGVTARPGQAAANSYLNIPGMQDFTSIVPRAVDASSSFIGNLFNTADEEKEAVFGLERPWDAVLSGLQYVDDRTNQAKSWAESALPGGVTTLSWDAADKIGPGQVGTANGAAIVRQLTDRLGLAGTAIGVMYPIATFQGLDVAGAVQQGMSESLGGAVAPYNEDDFTLTNPDGTPNEPALKAAFEDSTVGRLTSGAVQAGTAFADPFAAVGWAGMLAKSRYLDRPIRSLQDALNLGEEFNASLKVVQEADAARKAAARASAPRAVALLDQPPIDPNAPGALDELVRQFDEATPQPGAAEAAVQALPPITQSGPELEALKKRVSPIMRFALEAMETGPDGQRVRTATQLGNHRVLIDNAIGPTFGEALHSAESVEEAGLILMHGAGIPEATQALASYRPDVLTALTDAERNVTRLRLLWNPDKQEEMADRAIQTLNNAERELQRAERLGADQSVVDAYRAVVADLTEKAAFTWTYEIPPLGVGPLATDAERAAAAAGFATREARDEFFKQAVKDAQAEVDLLHKRDEMLSAITESPGRAGEVLPSGVTESFGALVNGRTGFSSDTWIGRLAAASRDRRAAAIYEARATRAQKWEWEDFFGNGPLKRASRVLRWAGAESPSGIVITHGIERVTSGVREVTAMLDDIPMYAAAAPKRVLRNGEWVEIGGVAQKERMLSEFRRAAAMEGPIGEMRMREQLLRMYDEIGMDIGAWYGLDESGIKTVLAEQFKAIDEFKSRVIDDGYWLDPDGTKIESPFLKSHLQNSMIMPNWREFDRAAKLAAMEPGFTKKVKSGASYAETTAMDWYSAFNHVWRPAVLLRVGFPQRNVLEGSIRGTVYLGSLDPFKWVAQNALGIGPANAARRAVHRSAMRQMPSDPQFALMPKHFTDWHANEIAYEKEWLDGSLAMHDGMELSLIDSSPSFRAQRDIELKGEVEALARANTELRGNTVQNQIVSDRQTEMLAKYPNMFPYRGGGFGGVGPESSTVGMVETDFLRTMHGNERDPGRLAAMGPFDPEKMTDPIMVMFDPGTGRMVVGEGNHRLELAAQAGVTHLPVRVYRSRFGDQYESPVQIAAPPSPWTGGLGEEYWPSDIHPSYVIPTRTVAPGEAQVTRYSLSDEAALQIERNIDDMAELNAKRARIAQRNAEEEALKAEVEALLKNPRPAVYVDKRTVTPAESIPALDDGRIGTPVSYPDSSNMAGFSTVSAIERETLPETVFHVTTDLPAVKADGTLRAFKGGQKAGLGGTHDGVVSVTVSEQTARQLEQDMRLYVSLRDARTVTDAKDTLVAEANRLGFDPAEIERTADMYVNVVTAKTKDAYVDSLSKLFFNMRQSAGIAPNPVIIDGFGMANSGWHNVTADNIGIVPIARDLIPENALVSNFDLGPQSDSGYGLYEARIHADVPLSPPLTRDDLTDDQLDALLRFDREDPPEVQRIAGNLNYLRQDINLRRARLDALNDPVTASTMYRDKGAATRRLHDGTFNSPDHFAFRAAQTNGVSPELTQAFNPRSNFSDIALSLASADTTNRTTAALRSDIGNSWMRLEQVKHYVEVKPGDAGYWDGYATALRQFQFSDVGNFIIHGKSDDWIADWLRTTPEGQETAAFVTNASSIKRGAQGRAKPFAERLLKAQKEAEAKNVNVKEKITLAETEAAEAKQMVSRARRDFKARQKDSKRPLKRYTDPETGRNWNSVEAMEDWLLRKQEAVVTAKQKWDWTMAKAEDEFRATMPKTFAIVSHQDALQYVQAMRDRLGQLTHGSPEMEALLRSTSLPVDQAGGRVTDSAGVAGDMIRSIVDRKDPSGAPMYKLKPIIGNTALDMGWKKPRQVMDSAIEAGFRWLGTKPEDFFLRQPFYGKRFADSIDTQARMAFEATGGQPISLWDWNRMERNAHLRALSDTKSVLYTLDRRTVFGRFWEKFMPFVSATQNAVTVGGRLVYNRPMIIPFAAHAWQVPETVGLVDENGRIMLPIPHALIPDGLEEWAGLDNQKYWTISPDQLNLFLPMSQTLGPIPQLGPWIGLPADFLMKNNLFGASVNPPDWWKAIAGEEAANGTWDFAMSLIYGDSSPSRSGIGWETVLPAAWREAVYRVLGPGSSAAYDIEWQNQMRSEVLKYIAGERPNLPDPEEINNRTNGNQIVRIFQRVFAAFVPQNYGLTEPLQDAVNAIEADMRTNPTKPEYLNPDGSRKQSGDVIRALFGDELAAVGNLSVTTPVGGMMSNSVSVDIAQAHGPMIGRIADDLDAQNQLSVLGMLSVGNEDAQYDKVARAWQMNNTIPGTNRNWYESKTPQASWLQSTTAAGWASWDAFDTSMQARMRELGITSIRSAKAFEFRKRRADWIAQAKVNPAFEGWYDDFYNGASGRTNMSIKLLQTATQDRGWVEAHQDDEVWRAGGIAANYLAARDWVVQTIELRKQQDPKAGGINSARNNDVREYWDAIRSQFAEQSPAWASLSSRYLTGDDDPQAPSVVVTPPEAQLIPSMSGAAPSSGDMFMQDALEMGVG